MRLFGNQGFRATTIVQIEEASGLSPGSGAVYHHFRSKEDVLTAGIDRHLDRMRALRDVRAVLGTLPDRDVELAVIARYGLQVLDEEAPLLRLLASEQANPPAALDRARDVGLAVLRHELRDWIVDTAPDADHDRVTTTAIVAADALIAHRLPGTLLGAGVGPLSDEQFVDEWVALVGGRLGALA